MQTRLSKLPFINDDARNGSDCVQRHWPKKWENIFVQCECHASHSISNVWMQKHFVQQHHKDYPNHKHVAEVDQKVQGLHRIRLFVYEASFCCEDKNGKFIPLQDNTAQLDIVLVSILFSSDRLCESLNSIDIQPESYTTLSVIINHSVKVNFAVTWNLMP